MSMKRSKTRRLTRESLGQILDGGGLLLLANFFVLLLVGSSLQPLPWKSSPQEVHKDMTQCLQIVPTRLLPPQMRVDAHVSSRSRQRLPFSVRDVLL
jgi:hypothetical protein